MSGTDTMGRTSTSGAAVGGGGSGNTLVGGSTLGLTGTSDLPPQYATGNTGFFTRQTEAVPTAVTMGPDGAIYVSELNGIPYPTGYSSIYPIDGTDTTTGYDGAVSSGVPQAIASGFSEVNGLAFNNSTGDMYVLEYLNANAIYDPTLPPDSLPPSVLIQVKTDGSRTTVSGPELHLGDYVTVDPQTGDVYVAVNDQGPATAASPGTGHILDYQQDAATGNWTSSVIASGLNDPRGMSIGPDGNLYVLEQGTGTPRWARPCDRPGDPVHPGLGQRARRQHRLHRPGRHHQPGRRVGDGAQRPRLVPRVRSHDRPGPRDLDRHERPDDRPGRHGLYRRRRRPRAGDGSGGRFAGQPAAGRAEGGRPVRGRSVERDRHARVQFAPVCAGQRSRWRHDALQHREQPQRRRIRPKEPRV